MAAPPVLPVHRRCCWNEFGQAPIHMQGLLWGPCQASGQAGVYLVTCGLLAPPHTSALLWASKAQRGKRNGVRKGGASPTRTSRCSSAVGVSFLPPRPQDGVLSVSVSVSLSLVEHLSCSHHALQCPVRACPAHHCLGLHNLFSPHPGAVKPLCSKPSH